MSEKGKCMQNMYAGEELKQTLTIAIFFYNLHTYTTRLANQNYV